MHDYINEISKIEVPDEIISHLDVQGMLHDLRMNFKRIDEYRIDRQNKEKKGLGRKLLDFARRDSPLDDAHLGALVAQASFSKAIGELLALSIMLSQRLEQQSSAVASQQATLSKHTASIGENTESIFEQQKKLEHQNLELEVMVNDLIKIKGLTQEEADELIAIANDVKSIRAELGDFVLSSLSESLGEIKATKEEILSALEANRSFVNAAVAEVKDEVVCKLQSQSDQVGEAIHATLNRVSTFHTELLDRHVNTENKFNSVAGEISSLQARQASDYENVWRNLHGHAERLAEQGYNLTGQSDALIELKAELLNEQALSEAIAIRLGENLCQLENGITQVQKSAEEGIGNSIKEIQTLRTKQEKDVERTDLNLNTHTETLKTQKETLFKQEQHIIELTAGLQEEREFSAGLLNKLDEFKRMYDEQNEQSAAAMKKLYLLLSGSLAFSVGILGYILLR